MSTEYIGFTGRERLQLIFLGHFFYLPIIVFVVFFRDCGFTQQNYGIHCLTGYFLLTLGLVSLIRNVLLMQKHDWYRTRFTVTDHLIEAISSSGKVKTGKFSQLAEIEGRARPPSIHLTEDLSAYLGIVRDAMLLRHDLQLDFSDGTRIIVPRVGFLYENHSLLSRIAEPIQDGNPMEGLLWEWKTWREALLAREPTKFGAYPSRSMYKWHLICQIPWVFMGVLIVVMDRMGTPFDISDGLAVALCVIPAITTLIAVGTIHVLLWLKQRPENVDGKENLKS